MIHISDALNIAFFILSHHPINVFNLSFMEYPSGSKENNAMFSSFYTSLEILLKNIRIFLILYRKSLKICLGLTREIGKIQ